MKAQMELNGHYMEELCEGDQGSIYPTYPSGTLGHETYCFFNQSLLTASECGFICILIFFHLFWGRERDSLSFVLSLGSKETYEAT